MRPLNTKQRAFVAAYLRLGVGRSAAIEAGYAAPSAGKMASMLLADQRVQALLASTYTAQRAVADIELAANLAAERSDHVAMLKAIELRIQLGLVDGALPGIKVAVPNTAVL